MFVCKDKIVGRKCPALVDPAENFPRECISFWAWPSGHDKVGYQEGGLDGLRVHLGPT